ncbi:MAG: UDP-N-acetylmuramate--L-alanine ligase [Deltaproteobacteria bacterium]|nr:UDP-N-acetylmuramate--L-alanine ligase [Deltaproteobacteria bacterium]
MNRRVRGVHFVGIGGSGMSGIAEVLLNLAYRVTGSDLAESEATLRLKRLGAEVSIGHRPENLKDADVVVISSAVRKDNPEMAAARERNIPVIARAEMLAELMRLKYGVAVAGTHGKTTTTSMIATVLTRGGLDPTAVIGGKLNIFASNAKLGQGELLVAEADESDGSFLKLSPTIAVVTNIDAEHLDHYRDLEEIRQAFLQFINKVPFYGLAVLCLDQENVQALIPFTEKRFVTYGLTSQANFRAADLSFHGLTTTFRAFSGERELGRISIRMPGVHNVYNALATLAVAIELDLSFETVREALGTFSGVQRRFQIKGEFDGVLVVDDYGHHPTEIKATLSAAKAGWERRIVVVFQPHRYSRTRDLYKDFLTAFNQADLLFLTGIYPAGEDPIPGIDVQALYEGIKRHGHKDVTLVAEKPEILDQLLPRLRPGDMIFTLGAGDIWKVGEELIRRLKKTPAGREDQG